MTPPSGSPPIRAPFLPAMTIRRLRTLPESRDVKCVLAEFPTTMEAAAECNDAGMAVMMGAPNLMRGKSHSGNISADELVAPGYLQILSSDYVPSTLLRAAVKLAQTLDDLSAAMATVTSEPARVTGLDDRADCGRSSCRHASLRD